MPTLSTPLVSIQSPKDVSLSQIESELTQIWQMYNAANTDGSSGAMRAATFTLVVYEHTFTGEAQQLLTALGVYHGPIDGIYGPQTEVAIRAFLKDHGSDTLTGKIDAAFLSALQAAVTAKMAANGGSSAPITSYSQTSAGAMADAIASQNPCRIIALLPKTGDDDGVTAQVSAYCPIQKRGQSTLICCEYITLRGTESALDRTAGLVSSLLISELPKHLWWKDSPDLDLQLFRQLGQLCNSVIVDSSRFSNPEAELLVIHQLVAEGIQIADLNWARLAAWQELTAEAFDPPQRRAALKEVDRVTIDFEKGNATQALMFVGWLASRLQWHPMSYQRQEVDFCDEHHIECVAADQRVVKVELVGVPTGDAGEVIGDLIGLQLTSTNDQADCCTILCSETMGCMRMESGGKAQNCRVNQVTSLADQSAETLLGQQLQRWGQDLLYAESLAVTAQMLRASDP